MPPISSSPVDARLEIRQTPQPYIITQTIADPSTTYTTTLTLGTYTLPAAPAPTSTSPPATTTISTVTPAKTTTDNSGVVVGAVLGTFLGLAVLLALVWKCCFDGRSVLYNRYWGERDEDRSERSYRSGSGSGSLSLGSSRSRSRHRRVKRRGGEIRRPKRAHVKRDRRESFDEYGVFDEEGWDEKRSRRGSRTVVKNGMVGWTFGGGGRKSGSRRNGSRRRDWVESETVRVRYTTDD
jgi:hypothetical protein